jgi:hypothetical protein
MIDYTCNNCSKKFKNKTDFIRHLNRKFPCKKILYIKTDQDVNTISSSIKNGINESQRIISESQRITKNSEINKIVKHECNYCNKIFSTNSNLRRHERLYCKVIKQNKLNETILLKKEIILLKNQNKKIMKIINNNNQVIKQNNITNNNTNKLNANHSFNTVNNIVKFGNEDLDYITDNVYKKLMNKGYQSVPQLINYIHFNKNKPENHNIIKTNMRDNKISIFDGEKFILVDKQNILEQLYDTKSEIIEMKFDEIKDDLSDKVINKISRFIRDKDNDKHKTLILKDIDLLTYNNRDIPLKTKHIKN